MELENLLAIKQTDWDRLSVFLKEKLSEEQFEEMINLNIIVLPIDIKAPDDFEGDSFEALKIILG